MNLFKFFLVFVTWGSFFVNAYDVESISESFLNWKRDKVNNSSNLFILNTSDGIKSTGWFPSPIPKEVYKPKYSGLLDADNYPVRFDLSDPNLDGSRDDSNLTTVKNQGSCGVCWAFASYGAYEGALSTTLEGIYDLSEQHLRYNNGSELTNNDPCSGGNLAMVIGYLTRGSGPVLEVDDPYDLSSGNSSNVNAEAIRYVDNIIELPVRDIENKRDIDYLKDIIYNQKKPLYVSVQVGNGTAGETGESVWEENTTSYFCLKDSNGNGCNPNHAVVIVGWDDDYEAQGQKGAFIVRNSWGEDWGEEGYFYVPYNDESIALNGTIAYFKDNPDKNLNINKIYQYNEFTPVYGWGNSSDDPVWGANKYIISNSGKIKAIGFYAKKSDTSYEIKLYKTITNNGGEITFSNQVGTTQTSANPISRGWHTIVLDNAIDVKKDDVIIVAIKFSNPQGYPLAIEGDVSNYMNATSDINRSFWSGDGVTFEDVQDRIKDYITDPDIAIKLLVEEKNKTKYDFNGDGIADILWRKDSGNYLWYMKADGSHEWKS